MNRETAHRRLQMMPLLLLVLTIGLLSGGCGQNPGDQAVYARYCASCHGPEGNGLRALYPPLRGSSYLTDRLQQLPCLIGSGVPGTIVNADGSTMMRMPSFNLSHQEMTALILFLHHEWGTGKAAVSEQTVSQWQQQCP